MANGPRRRKSRRTFGKIVKLPSGKYRASYIGPDGERRAAETTFPTVADADAWLSVIAADVIRGDWRPPEPARETFGSYAERWLATGLGRNGKPLSPTTKELYRILWDKWLAPTFKEIPLGDLGPELWRTWHASACAEHPGSTQPGKAFRLGRAILNTAVDDEKLRVNPCRVKGAGTENAPERPVATPAQVFAIAEAIDEDYRVLVLLAAYCQLRFGELAGLKRSRVDILHRTIDVVEQVVELRDGSVMPKAPKSDSARKITVPLDLVPLLEDHLAERTAPDADALLFTSPEGHPLRRTKFRPRWLAACKAAGVSGLHLHDLRGSGATWAAQEGATTAELMHRLGHRTATVAMRYQHATIERDRAIADKIGSSLISLSNAGATATNAVEASNGKVARFPR